MKLWITMLSLAFAVASLCVWDSIHTSQVFNQIEKQSEHIYQSLLISDITDKKIQEEIVDLNNYWTKKMDTLSVSISRKDLQPVSDYLQYLHSSIINSDQESAITYSRLLNYNIVGLKETNGFDFINLL